MSTRKPDELRFSDDPDRLEANHPWSVAGSVSCTFCRYRQAVPNPNGRGKKQFLCTHLRMNVRWREHMKTFRKIVHKGNRYCRHWENADGE